MITATSGAEEDDRPQSHSLSAPLKDITNAVTPRFLQQWNEFYIEFVQSNSYYCNATLMSATSAIDTVGFVDTAQPQCTQQSSTTIAIPMTLHQPCPPLPELLALILMTNQIKISTCTPASASTKQSGEQATVHTIAYNCSYH